LLRFLRVPITAMLTDTVHLTNPVTSRRAASERFGSAYIGIGLARTGDVFGGAPDFQGPETDLSPTGRGRLRLHQDVASPHGWTQTCRVGR
jgi:hypothetical protein